MITQTNIGLNSRSEANPYDEEGFLPIITSNMYSVVDKHNAHIFLDHKIKVCMPRKEYMDNSYQYCSDENYFDSFSLDDFIKDFVETTDGFLQDNKSNKVKTSVCIDTAAGHLLKLHDAIRKAKEIHGDNLIIMAGNVASVEAFVELAKTGVDYIRVGIGGGCLAADTRVLMADGTYKNIIDIQIGDFVINKDGYPVKVINTFYSGKKKVSRVKHNVFYKSLVITNNHKIRVSDLSTYKKSSISSKGYKAFFKKDIWKSVSESINDNLLSPTKIKYDLPEDFNINLNQFDSDKSKNVIGNIKPSYELGYIFGTFLGDGNINIREDVYVKRNSINKTGSVHWTFGKNESSIVLTLVEYIENIFKEESGFREEINKIRLSLYRKWVANLFSEFYKEDGTKYLPTKWYCLNKDYLTGLYNGLIDSDGHKEPIRDCFENTSPYLIELIYFIKSNLQNYFPNSEERKKTCGNLKNCNEDNLKQSYSLRTLSNYLARQTEHFNLLKVTSFENEFNEIDTYDIEVDCPTHSFIANNCIVHNSGCNTTSNTGVGQEDLGELISLCSEFVDNSTRMSEQELKFGATFLRVQLKTDEHINITPEELKKVSKVKIVADGISSYVKLCQDKYGFNDNGYAAINKLLFAGADLVMVGKLFVQCLESAGEKAFKYGSNGYETKLQFNNLSYEDAKIRYFKINQLFVKYSGMSTRDEQVKYKSDFYWKWWWGDSIIGSVKDEIIFYDFEEMKTHSSKHSFLNSICNQNYYSNYTKHENKKPSEGSVSWIPVRWTLSEWLHGSDKQDESPYLMGWVNSIKSAMSYTNKTKL